LSDPERRLLTSFLACIVFGYAAVSCLVLYRRMRQRIAEYKARGEEGPHRLERIVHSPQYGLTMWLTGAIGAIGFAIASWELLLNLLAILHRS
jgi:hypothetical protein